MILGSFVLTVVLLIIDLNIMKTDDVYRKTIFKEYSKDTLLDTDHFFFHYFCITITAFLSYIYQRIMEFLKKDSTLQEKIMELYRKGKLLIIFISFYDFFFQKKT